MKTQVTQLMLEQFVEHRSAPRWWPSVVKNVVWPWWAARRQIVVNSYPPHVQTLFGLEWTPEDDDLSRRFMQMYRRVHAALERRLPLKFLYLPVAVEGFEREGIDPREITLESAQQALRESRAARASARTDDADEVLATG